MSLAIALFLLSALLYTYAGYAPRRTEPRFDRSFVRKPRRGAASRHVAGRTSTPPMTAAASSPRVARRTRGPLVPPWRKPAGEQIDGVALLQAAWRGEDKESTAPEPAASGIDTASVVVDDDLVERAVGADGSGDVRTTPDEAIAWLQLVDDSRATATREERFEIVRSLGVIRTDWGASILADVLRSEPDGMVRYGALEAIRDAKYVSSANTVAERSLAAADVAERELALDVLIALGAFHLLDGALDDPDDRIARAAAVAVCRPLTTADAIDAHLAQYVEDAVRREALLAEVLSTRRDDGAAGAGPSSDSQEDNVA